MPTCPADYRASVDVDVDVCTDAPRTSRLRLFQLMRERLGPRARNAIDWLIAVEQLKKKLSESDGSGWEGESGSVRVSTFFKSGGDVSLSEPSVKSALGIVIPTSLAGRDSILFPVNLRKGGDRQAVDGAGVFVDLVFQLSGGEYFDPPLWGRLGRRGRGRSGPSTETSRPFPVSGRAHVNGLVREDRRVTGSLLGQLITDLTEARDRVLSSA